MRNIKLTIEYEGTNYGGWQKQRVKKGNGSINTIQETIEQVLERVLREKVNLIGSGRTDSGVHALGQVANFKTSSPLGLKSLQNALNSLLPRDIMVREVEEVEEGFNACYWAKSKVYCYTILNEEFLSPFLARYTYFYPYPLNLRLMDREARCLLGKNDLRSFCASGSGAKTTIRTIKSISVQKLDTPPYPFFPKSRLVVIRIEADGFLYKMVRNIAGTLIEISRGKIKGMEEVLKAKDRRKAGPTIPAHGLCLLKVNY